MTDRYWLFCRYKETEVADRSYVSFCSICVILECSTCFVIFSPFSHFSCPRTVYKVFWVAPVGSQSEFWNLTRLFSFEFDTPVLLFWCFVFTIFHFSSMVFHLSECKCLKCVFRQYLIVLRVLAYSLRFPQLLYKVLNFERTIERAYFIICDVWTPWSTAASSCSVCHRRCVFKAVVQIYTMNSTPLSRQSGQN